MYTIEKGVPPPTEPGRKRGRPPGLSAALLKMEVGDSFLVPVPTSEKSTRSSVNTTRRRVSPDIVLSMRMEGNSLRVWRTS